GAVGGPRVRAARAGPPRGPAPPKPPPVPLPVPAGGGGGGGGGGGRRRPPRTAQRQERPASGASLLVAATRMGADQSSRLSRPSPYRQRLHSGRSTRSIA